MFTVFGFLTKRDGLGMRDVIDYYEGKHIPVILGLGPAPLIYKRGYLVRDKELTKSGNLVDYDVMTLHGWGSFQPWNR